MSDSPFIHDLNEQNFESIVIQGSHERPVLVDFWASWCQPCQMLMPLLSRLAEEYGGRFLLGKLNTEENQALATQFGIRSIPNVKLFRNGQEIDEFSGALPESEIRAFIEKHLPRESDNLVENALQAYASGDSESALAMLAECRQSDPDNPRVVLAMAQIHAATGDPESALQMLDALPAAEQEKQEVEALRNQLFFAGKAPQAATQQELEAQLEKDPGDSQTRYQLAMTLVQTQQFEPAIDQLLTLMAKDRNYGDDAARKALLKLFDMLGDDPLVAQGRRRLFNMMH